LKTVFGVSGRISFTVKTNVSGRFSTHAVDRVDSKLTLIHVPEKAIFPMMYFPTSPNFHRYLTCTYICMYIHNMYVNVGFIRVCIRAFCFLSDEYGNRGECTMSVQSNLVCYSLYIQAANCSFPNAQYYLFIFETQMEVRTLLLSGCYGTYHSSLHRNQHASSHSASNLIMSIKYVMSIGVQALA
jgi:hypothetical protein